ncbi:MAG: pilus assembly protein [Planctomycetota bacterium]|nr:MAG: pilus assembly protein [Planctomycetota bacterium]
MFMLVLGSIEITNSIYLKQALTSVAYEGARLASGASGTKSDAESFCTQLLTARQIQGASVSCTQITPATTRGTLITVTVTAPAEQNSFGLTRYFRNRDLTAAATMPRL